jgi:hypothetical protein
MPLLLNSRYFIQKTMLSSVFPSTFRWNNVNSAFDGPNGFRCKMGP